MMVIIIMAESAIDYLKQDDECMQMPGQKYALISVVSPVSNQKNDACGVKIRGVFENINEAKKQAEMISKLDSIFDVYLVELYKWLPIPPNDDMIKSQEYQDEVLNTLIQGHADEQIRAKQFFEERKHEVMQGKQEPNDSESM